MELAKAVRLGEQLTLEHGLSGWQIVLDRAKTRAGACRWARREISLSRHLTPLHPEEQVRDTLLHEIAHALVGPGHGHDDVWRSQARALGCSARRCVPDDVPAVQGPWQGRCPAGHEAHRHRRPPGVLVCARCTGPPTSRVMRWTYLGQAVELGPGYDRELAAFLDPRARVPRAPVRVGEAVRVTAPGRWHGHVGTITKRGRSRYHVRVAAALITVPFAFVEPSSAGR